MTIRELKELLQNKLDMLEDWGFEDDEKIAMVSNTYFLGDSRAFLGISGNNGGYINLDCIEVEENEGDK